MPDQPPSSLPPITAREVDVCIVGAGPAGLAAAAAIVAARPRMRILLVDDQLHPGGSLLALPGGTAQGAKRAADLIGAGVDLMRGAEAIGVYRDAHAGLATLAVSTPQGLQKVHARRFLYATGAYEQGLPFPDADHPGVMPFRTTGRLAFGWGVAPIPGEGRLFIASPQPKQSGSAATALVEIERSLVRGLRERGVDVDIVDADGALPKANLKRDMIAMVAMPSPASELPRQHGAEVVYDLERGGFPVTASGDGRCAPDVYVAGDVTGFMGPEAAAAAGARTGAALAATL